MSNISSDYNIGNSDINYSRHLQLASGSLFLLVTGLVLGLIFTQCHPLSPSSLGNFFIHQGFPFTVSLSPLLGVSLTAFVVSSYFSRQKKQKEEDSIKGSENSKIDSSLDSATSNTNSEGKPPLISTNQDLINQETNATSPELAIAESSISISEALAPNALNESSVTENSNSKSSETQIHVPEIPASISKDLPEASVTVKNNEETSLILEPTPVNFSIKNVLELLPTLFEQIKPMLTALIETEYYVSKNEKKNEIYPEELKKKIENLHLCLDDLVKHLLTGFTDARFIFECIISNLSFSGVVVRLKKNQKASLDDVASWFCKAYEDKTEKKHFLLLSNFWNFASQRLKTDESKLKAIPELSSFLENIMKGRFSSNELQKLTLLLIEKNVLTEEDWAAFIQILENTLTKENLNLEQIFPHLDKKIAMLQSIDIQDKSLEKMLQDATASSKSNSFSKTLVRTASGTRLGKSIGRGIAKKTNFGWSFLREQILKQFPIIPAHFTCADRQVQKKEIFKKIEFLIDTIKNVLINGVIEAETHPFRMVVIDSFDASKKRLNADFSQLKAENPKDLQPILNFATSFLTFFTDQFTSRIS